ncbi:MAG: molybdopterin molybdotransferase MoeA [Candidatus Villigracilaceae bacterium]
MALISVNEARQRILDSLTPVDTLNLHLRACGGRILAKEIRANTELPPFDNSGMDGFAVRAADTLGASPASPRTLRVVADIPAGTSPECSIAPGEAARIMTGAPMPPGADAVVPVEDTDFNHRLIGEAVPKNVRLFQPVQPGRNVRLRGSDVALGQIVLQTGQKLRAQDLGLLAMLGFTSVPVYRQPRLALFSSGNELILADEPLVPGKVRDANSYTLTALAQNAGAEVTFLGIAADTREAVKKLLDQAIENRADLIVSSAGVSVGAFDFVKDVVESHGHLNFWKVNMRPGKPLAFGAYRGVPFFGLPGNPVSAFVGFEVFVRPAIEQLSGRQYLPRMSRTVHLAESVESDGRETYLRAVVSQKDGQLQARLTGHQGSGNLLSLVQANALLIIPSGVKSLPPGAAVEAWLL